MKFARICFASDNRKRTVWDRLPEFIRRKYYLDFYKQHYENIKMFSSIGELVSLPFRKDECDFFLVSEYLKKVSEYLKNNDVGVVCVQKGIQMPYGVKTAYGDRLLCFMAEDIVNTACKIRNLNLDESEITVIDGGENTTEILLNVLSRKVSRLYVYTLRQEKLKPVFEDIFEETGLCIVSFSAANDSLMSKSDIVINLNHGNLFMNCFSKNTVYIDIAGDSRCTEYTLDTRKDITVIENFTVRQDKTDIPIDYTEAALSAAKPYMHRAVFGEFSKDVFQKTHRYIKSFGFDIICVIDSDIRKSKALTM